jgi:hypothetical protein
MNAVSKHPLTQVTLHFQYGPEQQESVAIPVPIVSPLLPGSGGDSR